MKNIAILGAGIAGLSAGYYLENLGINYKIFEKSETYGGLARSFLWHGFHCDFAAHRFFSNDKDVESDVLNLIPMVYHTRRSKLYMKGQWISDPINPIELIHHIPIKEKIQLVTDLLRKEKNFSAHNFQEYVINKHGNYMFQNFFKPYTEKLFGIKSNNISVLWAKNKVRLNNPFKNTDKNTKKYFSYFYYPISNGYGAIADVFYKNISEHILFNSSITSVNLRNDEIISVDYELDGNNYTYECDAVISTLPLSLTAMMLDISFSLSYRKVDAVYLLVNRPFVSENHWIYFSDEDISINRLVEFKNLSPVNCPDENTVICAEVTRNEPDVLNKVIKDLVCVGLLREDDILDAKIVRQDYGYPVYSIDYEEELIRIFDEIGKIKNFFILGRAAEFIHREVDDIIGASKRLIMNIANSQSIMEDIIKISETKMKKICIILLTYNNLKDTLECIKSIKNLNGGPFTIYLVDNGSSDNTVETISKYFPEIKLIPLVKNLGVPGGFNQGIYASLIENFEFVFLLNNDTVVHPDILNQMLSIFDKDQNCGLVMPKIYYYPPQTDIVGRDKVWADGGYYRKFPPTIKLKDDRKGIDFDKPRIIDYAPTCALLIHRSVFQKIGLFDPGYFFFYEDWDFSERVRNANFNMWCAPEAKLWHKVSSTTKKDLSLYWKMMGKSGIRFFRRHNGFLSTFFQTSYIILREFIFKIHNFKYLKTYVAGVREGIFNTLDDYPDISNLLLIDEDFEPRNFNES